MDANANTNTNANDKWAERAPSLSGLLKFALFCGTLVGGVVALTAGTMWATEPKFITLTDNVVPPDQVAAYNTFLEECVTVKGERNLRELSYSCTNRADDKFRVSRVTYIDRSSGIPVLIVTSGACQTIQRNTVGAGWTTTDMCKVK